jgi:hypothetical protein
MIKAASEKKEPCPDLVFGKATVIVLVIRGRPHL